MAIGLQTVVETSDQMFNVAFDNAEFIQFKLSWYIYDGSFRKVTKYKLKPGQMLATKCMYLNTGLLLIGSRFGTFVLFQHRTSTGMIRYYCEVPERFYEYLKNEEWALLSSTNVASWLFLILFVSNTTIKVDSVFIERLIGSNVKTNKIPNIGQWLEKLFA